MESHQLDDYDVDPKEVTAKIERFLMLREGKLIDELNSTDEQIRNWVRRLADGVAQAADREQTLQQMDDLSSEAAVGREDRQAMVFIRDLLLNEKDNETAEVALEVLNTRYLEEEPQLRL